MFPHSFVIGVVADIKMLEERLAKRTRGSVEENTLRLLAACEEVNAIHALKYAHLIDEIVTTTGEAKNFLEDRARIILVNIHAKFKTQTSPAQSTKDDKSDGKFIL